MSFANVAHIYKPDLKTQILVPLYSAVQAGFPSPAEDYTERMLDLNSYLITNPPATFIVRVTGDSMLNAGILSDDLLIVDRSITARDGCIVVAILNNEFTVKRLRIKGKNAVLMPENDAYPPVPIVEGMDFDIWGVVSSLVRKTVC